MKAHPLAWLLAALPLAAQESTRDIHQPGVQTKHLTMDTVDLWRLEAKPDEVLRVVVSSDQFDPVIELVRLGDGDQAAEVVVPERDDEGSTSTLLARIAVAGRYGVRVHGPEKHGGGNYRFQIERFLDIALPEGAREVEGQLGPDGSANVRFAARKGETLAAFGGGEGETLLDPMGHPIAAWEHCYEIEHDGAHYLRCQGAPGTRFRAGIERARRRALGATVTASESLPSFGLDEWTFTGSRDDFRSVVVRGQRVAVRITSPVTTGTVELDDRPALRWLPAHAKGDTRRFAFVLGNEREYRVQVRSWSFGASTYELSFSDPTIALAPGTPIERALPVGGSEFFAFAPKPGQVLRIDVESSKFDPLLRLTTSDGVTFGENDDGGNDLASRHGWLVTGSAAMRAQVACFGDGGGGGYKITLTDVPVPNLPSGEVRRGTIGEGATEHWHLEGRAGQTLFLSSRSSTADTAIALFDPSGVQVGKDEDAGGDRNALLAIRLRQDGRYTLAVSTRSGRGEYLVQAIDPDHPR